MWHTYRWTLPSDQMDSFIADWQELALAARRHGAQSLQLFLSEKPGEFVALVCWPNREAWCAWKAVEGCATVRAKYRNYQTSGPEALALVADT